MRRKVVPGRHERAPQALSALSFKSAACAAAIVLVSPGAPAAPSLRTFHGPVLSEAFLSVADAPPDIAPLLELATTSGAVLADARGTVFAGYLGSEVSPQGGLLCLRVIERGVGGRWRQADLGGRHGSVNAIRRMGVRLLVETHHSPSATDTCVLGPELELERVLPARVAALLDDRFALVVLAQPHFGAVRELRLVRYDLATGAMREVHPSARPGRSTLALRAQAAARFRDAGDDWCREKNHPCDPTRLESWLGELVQRDDSVAFTVACLADPLDRQGPVRTIACLLPHAASPDPVVEEDGILEPQQDVRAALERMLDRVRRPHSTPTRPSEIDQ